MDKGIDLLGTYTYDAVDALGRRNEDNNNRTSSRGGARAKPLLLLPHEEGPHGDSHLLPPVRHRYSPVDGALPELRDAALGSRLPARCPIKRYGAAKRDASPIDVPVLLPN